MAEEIEDPAAEQIAKSVRALLMAAGVAAEHVAQGRRNAAEQKMEAAGHEANLLQSRWDAERSLAIVEVTSADAAWFDRATPEQAGAVWQTAHAWSEVDPEFWVQASRIGTEIENRYGVDIAAVSAEGGHLSDEMNTPHDVEKVRSPDQDRERLVDEATAETILLTASADYDTDHRRDAMGERARAAGVEHDVADGRVRAANAHSAPVKDATKSSSINGLSSVQRQSPTRSRNPELDR